MRELNENELSSIYGGFWAALLEAAPIVINSVIGLMATSKILKSNSGSVKFGTASATWKSSAPTAQGSVPGQIKQTVFYAY